MRVLLTVLSVLAGWSLLGALAAGLLLILKPLEGVRASLRKITMGVRAIEQETAPLGPGAGTLVGSLNSAAGTLGSATQRLADINADLDRVADVLKARSGREGGAHA
jgi:ABC-type transporter Mla subunit MlaD